MRPGLLAFPKNVRQDSNPYASFAKEHFKFFNAKGTLWYSEEAEHVNRYAAEAVCVTGFGSVHLLAV